MLRLQSGIISLKHVLLGLQSGIISLKHVLLGLQSGKLRLEIGELELNVAVVLL
jgi:hypothetical protein